MFGVKFDRVWREYFEDQNYQVSVNAITESRVTSKRNMTNRWIRSRFASKAIDSITNNDMREFWQWRINFADSDEAKDALKATGGKYFAKKPKPVTLHEESMVISQIFRFAESKKYIKNERIPDLSPPVKWSTNRRYPFDRKEIKTTLVELARRTSEAKPVRADAWLRLIARVHLMVDTGMRPTEANNLKWGDYHLGINLKMKRHTQTYSCLSMKLSKAAETQRMSHRGFQSLCHIRVRTVQLPPTSL